MPTGARDRYQLGAFVAVLLALTAAPALAYVGPGAGLSMIGSLVALVGAVFAGIFGFIWFPVKRMLARNKKKSDTGEAP